jgi:hypothetical protein
VTLSSLLQENTSISEWEKLLSATLGPSGYTRLAWHSLRAIHLVLYAGMRFRRQVLSIHGSSVATGIGNVVGNKVGSISRSKLRPWRRSVHGLYRQCCMADISLGSSITHCGCLICMCTCSNEFSHPAIWGSPYSAPLHDSASFHCGRHAATTT